MYFNLANNNSNSNSNDYVDVVQSQVWEDSTDRTINYNYKLFYDYDYTT